ncbi:MAG TPA: methyltransferase domain-containing protein [Thermomonospora sp.]|nr:methyltransferase domain-containing protein [Thermomonospora sp.]
MTSEPLGEHAVFRAYLGTPRGARVLDLGRTAPEAERWALKGGAADYHGVDAADLGRWSGAGLGTFDLVLSWMALHRVRNVARLLETVHHHLVPGGRLVFAVPHPVVTADPDRPGGGGYFREGQRTAGDVVFWHRTLESYLYELRCCGFRLVELSEGTPVHGAGPVAPELPFRVTFRCQRRTR